ncbi:CLUMA_CG000223, isoform A [Clunio marinus]|uniref:CLUMA_CG000223, isoform A n=1 Tax=Clunio marinus TaxID=568069 RepID=A0A1J1HGK0_9DIPT|nr:CLUMA_CG000223, isoform A [Clunio marinus]
MSLKSYLEFINGKTSCEVELRRLLNAFNESEKWALDVVDSWGDPSKALQNSRSFDFGRFVDCTGFQNDSFSGKYCVAKFSPMRIKAKNDDSHQIWRLLSNLKSEFKSGLCIPSVCNEKELKDIGQSLTDNHSVELNFVKCYEPFTFKMLDYVLIFILLTVIFIVIFCTIGSEIINCIDAIKVLSAIWIIIGHRNDMIAQLFGYKTEQKTLWSSAMNNMILSYFNCVDTFLTCSAILVTQSFLKLFDSGKFRLLQVLILRYLRYLPILGILLMFSASSLPQFFASGPLFFIIRQRRIKCSQTWWSTLLFIQNFVHVNDSCMNYAWYLAVDLQLFLLATVFTYLLWLFGKKFLRIIFLVICSLQFCTFIKLQNKTMHPIKWYKQPQYRLAEYLVGIMFGYLMYTKNKKKLNLGKSITSACWMLSLGFLGTHIFTRSLLTYNGLFKSFIESVHLEIWTCSISWIIFACHVLKSGNILRKFLSHSFWQPLSKICLSVYLAHFKYLEITHLNQKEFNVQTLWQKISIFTTDVVISFILGLILFIENITKV